MQHVVPIRCSKRIFEISVPLPSNKVRRPEHTKGNSGRRNKVRKPQRDNNTATDFTPDLQSILNAPTSEVTTPIALVPPEPTNAGGGGPNTRKVGNPSKPRLTEEEKRERNRKHAAEKRQHQRENGLCMSCPNKPIEGQTRCPECAERHRQHWQNWKPKRKSSQPRSEN